MMTIASRVGTDWVSAWPCQASFSRPRAGEGGALGGGVAGCPQQARHSRRGRLRVLVNAEQISFPLRMATVGPPSPSPLGGVLSHYSKNPTTPGVKKALP